MLLAVILAFSNAVPVYADDHEEAPAEEAGPVDDYLELLEAQGDYAPAYDFFTTSMLWTVIAAALVFLMHLGFATLESGLCQKKNTVNILFKNVFIISIGILTYALFGFNTHYPGDFNGWFSWGGMIGDLNADGGATWGYGGLGLAMTGFGDFIFHNVCCHRCNHRIWCCCRKSKTFFFHGICTAFRRYSYPVAGSWHWGGGVLAEMGLKILQVPRGTRFWRFWCIGMCNGSRTSPWQVHSEWYKAHSCTQLPTRSNRCIC